MSAAEPFVVPDAAARLDELRPLWLQLRDHHGAVEPRLGPTREDEESWTIVRERFGDMLAEDGAFLVLAEDGETPAAFAIVTVHDGAATWSTPARLGFVEAIVVDGAQRGLGLGARMMDAVQAELDRHGVDELQLSVMAGNLGAQAFYRELGFDTHSLNLYRRAGGGQDA